MGFLVSRLDAVREDAVRRMVPFPERVPRTYWPRITAFAFPYGMRGTLHTIVERLGLAPRHLRGPAPEAEVLHTNRSRFTAGAGPQG